MIYLSSSVVFFWWIVFSFLLLSPLLLPLNVSSWSLMLHGKGKRFLISIEHFFHPCGTNYSPHLNDTYAFYVQFKQTTEHLKREKNTTNTPYTYNHTHTHTLLLSGDLKYSSSFFLRKKIDFLLVFNLIWIYFICAHITVIQIKLDRLTNFWKIASDASALMWTWYFMIFLKKVFLLNEKRKKMAFLEELIFFFRIECRWPNLMDAHWYFFCALLLILNTEYYFEIDLMFVS